MLSSDVVVGGSLGKGNHGDESLLRAFLDRHGLSYGRRIVLRESVIEGASESDLDVIDIHPPRLLHGKRFWIVPFDQRRCRREIMTRGDGPHRDIVWLGGLLTRDGLHAKLRDRELDWAMKFCSRFIYYFGDATVGFDEQPAAARLTRTLDRVESFVAVRSPEAEVVLRNAGLKTTVHLGVDAVLFDQVVRNGLPFRRLEPAKPTLIIVPCGFRAHRFRPLWIAAARAAVRLGLKVRWLSMCDPEDLPWCEDLSAQMRAEAPGHPQEVRSFTGDPQRHFSDAACCVATRLHGAIFGLGSGLPTIGLPYDSKVERMFLSLGLDRWLSSPSIAERPGAADALLFELVRAGLDGEFRPDYAELERRVEAHRRTLAEFGRFQNR